MREATLDDVVNAIDELHEVLVRIEQAINHQTTELGYKLDSVEGQVSLLG